MLDWPEGGRKIVQDSGVNPQARRLTSLRSAVAEAGLEGLVVTDPVNRRYLSGFTGTNAMLLVLPDRASLFTDGRYWEQAEEQSPGWEVVRASRFLLPEFLEAMRQAAAERVGFESAHVTYALWQDLKGGVDPTELVPVAGLIERLRAVKDAGEITAIQRAAGIADAALEQAVPRLGQPGVRERDVTVAMETHISLAGADTWPGGFIVASGNRAALPHWRASLRRISTGEMVVIDWGCIVDGYFSDATRTYAVGRPPDELRQVYEIVLQAHNAGLAAVRPGVTGHDADAASREVIAGAGYGDYFGHSLGHGVGLAIHEAPRLAAESQDVLEVGNVVSVEPGIYLPGKGGVRIEDLVVVTEDGCRSLNQLPKAYREL